MAAGVNLGLNEQHQLTIEVSRAPWSMRAAAAAAPAFPTLAGSGSIAPVLLGYRFSTGAPGARLRVYGGVAAGATKFSGSVVFEGSGLRYSGATDKVRPSASGTAGASGAITQRLSYDVGYRYFYTDGFDVDTSVRKIAFPRSSAHIVSAGLSVRL